MLEWLYSIKKHRGTSRHKHQSLEDSSFRLLEQQGEIGIIKKNKNNKKHSTPT